MLSQPSALSSELVTDIPAAYRLPVLRALAGIAETRALHYAALIADGDESRDTLDAFNGAWIRRHQLLELLDLLVAARAIDAAVLT